jgi:hypothetical protein
MRNNKPKNKYVMRGFTMFAFRKIQSVPLKTGPLARRNQESGLVLSGTLCINVDTKSRKYGPGVDSASNRNEYQEYFLGGKRGRCVWLTTLPPSCAYCLETLGSSTSWNPKGLSRPVKGSLHLYKFKNTGMGEGCSRLRKYKNNGYIINIF